MFDLSFNVLLHLRVPALNETGRTHVAPAPRDVTRFSRAFAAGPREDLLPACVFRVPVGVAAHHGSLCSDKDIILTAEVYAESLMPLALKKAL